MHHTLHYGKSKKPLAWVRPDERYPSMWRIHWPDGEVSDMVNLTRARDAARVLCRHKHPKLPHDGKLHWKQDGGQHVVQAATAKKTAIGYRTSQALSIDPVLVP